VFRRVRPLLQSRGHEVYTPTLTGIGERSHLASPQVTLTTHVQDVVNVLRYEDLRDVVLLGFSYGGFVVTGAIGHIGDRVRHLVYLDAFLPGDGDTLVGLTGRPRADGVLALGEQWLVPPIPRDYEDAAEEAFAGPRRTPHPAGCFTEPVRLARPLEEYPFGRTYVKATDDPAADGPFWTAARRVRSSPAWNYREIATNHVIPVNRPDELAALLLDLA